MFSMSQFVVLISTIVVATSMSADEVKSLPTYGELPADSQYAGFVNATSRGNNKIHYWFCRAETKEEAFDSNTPLLIWLNGGPGASSETGLLSENLGPQKIDSKGMLSDNPDALTKQGYHLLVIDNPVGSGYSYTTDGMFYYTFFSHPLSTTSTILITSRNIHSKLV